MKKITAIALGLFATGLVIVGCESNEDATAPAAAQSAPDVPLPDGLVVADAPAGAQDVTKVKQTAKDGDAVVVCGWIGGQEAPLAKNRAVMTLADKSLPSCVKSPMDDCKTPWDSCCEPVEDRTAKTATVQVVDANGKPLAATLESIAGLKPLSKITVSGTARRPAGSDALVVEAKQIHVTP